MATRRPSTVCLYCQARQSAIKRRTLGSSTKRRMQTVVHRPENSGFLLGDLEQGIQESDPTLRVSGMLGQRKLLSPIDELREAALSFDALWKRRDLRVRVLRQLSNPWPEVSAMQQERRQKPPHILSRFQGAAMSQAKFRETIRLATSTKRIRQVIRMQLLHCEWPKDILRVVAVSMQDPKIAENLFVLFEPIMRALYRCRQNVSDPEVLRTLNIIISRYRHASAYVEPQLIFMALKFAARARSLPAMKKYLKLVREQGLTMSRNVFRATIAKFSIGYRGLGEIRNGRWKRNDLLQVLTGFDDAKELPADQQYHFGTFLDRSDWAYLHGWVAIIARCKDSQSLWREWELWKKNEARLTPKTLLMRDNGRQVNSRTRGDDWFVEQMAYSGDMEKAWKILGETGVDFRGLKTSVKDKLLDGVEHATIWNDLVRAEMIAKYNRDLSRIEKAFGVKWVRTGPGDQGRHELFMDQEEALEKLSEEGWELDHEYGYPDESDPLVPVKERDLHDAAEGNVAN